jgi:hypothetical protein
MIQKQKSSTENARLSLLFRSSQITLFRSRRMKWARHVACMGEINNVYKIVVGRHEKNR